VARRRVTLRAMRVRWLIAVGICGCGSATPAPRIEEPGPTEAEVRADKAAEDRRMEEARRRREEAAAEADKAAQEKADAEAVEKRRDEERAVHSKSCALSFPERLAAARAAVKKKPKECAWIATHCDWKPVVISKKKDGATTTSETEVDLVCWGLGKPATLKKPRVWWETNSEKCESVATDEDADCATVDPLDIEHATDEQIAGYKE
jgi:hypothetical protein